MPPQSRAQRRQQSARRAQTAPGAARQTTSDYDQSLLEAAEAEVAAEPLMPTSLPPRGAVTRAPRQARRPIARPSAEPVDYTADYDGARSDLIKITIWAVLLFGAMIAIKLSGIL
jgi:hypothetical protein